MVWMTWVINSGERDLLFPLVLTEWARLKRIAGIETMIFREMRADWRILILPPPWQRDAARTRRRDARATWYRPRLRIGDSLPQLNGGGVEMRPWRDDCRFKVTNCNLKERQIPA